MGIGPGQRITTRKVNHISQRIIETNMTGNRGSGGGIVEKGTTAEIVIVEDRYACTRPDESHPARHR